MKISRLLLLGLLLLTLCLSACSKPYVNLSIASQPNVNPDHSGRPSPVIVKMYELRSDLAFKQLDFQTLFEKPVQALGSDLIAADEIVLVPGEARKVSYMPSPDTKYVGLLGGFRQMERAHWREIKAVDPESGNLICIELNDASILMISDDKKGSWNPEEAVRRFQQQLQPQNTPAAAHRPVQYPGQYPGQYPAQSTPQYPAQVPASSQYPSASQTPAQYPAQYPSQTPVQPQAQYTPQYSWDSPPAPNVNAATPYGGGGQTVTGATSSAGATNAAGSSSAAYNSTLDQVADEAVRQSAGQAVSNAPSVLKSTNNASIPGASSSGGAQGYVLPSANRIGF